MAWLLTAIISLLIAVPAFAQVRLDLDETCTVTVGNQTAFVRPDGTFLVRNISIFQSRVTGVAPQLYRVRATCLRQGEMITGQSEFFSLTPGQTEASGAVFPSELDPIPVRINVTAPADFVPQGATIQLTVTATLPDGRTEDVTPRSAGTTYLSTNSNLLTVTEDGLVTGANTTSAPQTGTIAVLNEGNLATINFTAVGPSNDFDNDGVPNDYEDLFGLNKFVNDANGDLDNDGLTNIQEFNLGTIPNNPDTDGDGLTDSVDGDPLHPEEAPPTVAIILPTDGDTLIEGETIAFIVDASDDGLLASVELSTDTGFSQTFTQPPFEADFVVPIGFSQIVFTARATDGVPNVATTAVTANAIPDPLTIAVGFVVDLNGNPIPEATVTCLGFSSLTGVDGSFSVPALPTILGDIRCSTTVLTPEGTILKGDSARVPPVRGGLTDVGTITAGRPPLEILYGAAHDGPDGPSTLYTLDPETGTATEVGPIGFERVSGMDFDATTGILFATGELAGGGEIGYGGFSDTHVLITIDPATGAGTEVGATGVELLGFGNTVADISFRNSDNALYAYLESKDGLGTIDPLTGAATALGRTFVSCCGNGMAFSSEDSLLHSNQDSLHSLDQVTGVATIVAPMGFSPPADSFPRINAMDFQPETGILFSSLNDRFFGAENYLATVDTTTGVTTIIGRTVDGLDALAWVTGNDSDGDGLFDFVEAALGTDPAKADTDGDGLFDGFEVKHGFDPLTAGEETQDPDGDGLDNLVEQAAGTNPNSADSDGDGLSDAVEINVHGTDPVNTDTDGGGRSDGREVLSDGTDPLDPADDLVLP